MVGNMVPTVIVLAAACDSEVFFSNWENGEAWTTRWPNQAMTFTTPEAATLYAKKRLNKAKGNRGGKFVWAEVLAP